MMRLFPSLPLLAALLAILTSGCASIRRDGDASDAGVRGRMLAVNSLPPSLGFRRLSYHVRSCPPLGAFLKKHGQPDYLIEDSSFRSRKLVLYYLKSKRAWLLTLKSNGGQSSVEASGPEPIGRQTLALFDALDRLEKAAKALVETTAELRRKQAAAN